MPFATGVIAGQELGPWLRHLRKERRWTQQKTARAAGIARATLNRWETGTHLPRLTELETVLAALETTATARRVALQLLKTPQAQARVMAGAVHLAKQIGLPAKTGAGDLLRAMRLRRGLTLEEVSTQIGVSARTLRFWENSETRPSDARLHALCYLLGAHEEEILAVTSPDAFASRDVLSYDTVASHFIKLIGHRLPLRTHHLREMEFLILEEKAWRVAIQQPSAQRLLAHIYARHADYLSSQSRFSQAAKISENALTLMPTKGPRETFWLYAGIAGARAAVYRKAQPAPREGIRQLREWLPETSLPEFQAWILADMAKYQSLDDAENAGNGETAICLATEASRTALMSRNSRPGVEHQMREKDRAQVLLQVGHPAEALSVLSESQLSESVHRAEAALLLAEAHLALGSRSQAQDWTREAGIGIERDDLPHLLPRAEALARQF